MIDHDSLDNLVFESVDSTVNDITMTWVFIKSSVALPQSEHGFLENVGGSRVSGLQHYIVLLFRKRDGRLYFLDPTFAQFGDSSPTVYLKHSDLSF